MSPHHWCLVHINASSSFMCPFHQCLLLIDASLSSMPPPSCFRLFIPPDRFDKYILFIPKFTFIRNDVSLSSPANWEDYTQFVQSSAERAKNVAWLGVNFIPCAETLVHVVIINELRFLSKARSSSLSIFLKGTLWVSFPLYILDTLFCFSHGTMGWKHFWTPISIVFTIYLLISYVLSTFRIELFWWQPLHCHFRDLSNVEVTVKNCKAA